MKKKTSTSVISSTYNLSIHNQLLEGKQPSTVCKIYNSFGIGNVVIEPKSERLSLYTDDPNQLSTDKIHYRFLSNPIVRNPDGSYPIPGIGILCGQFSNNVVCIAYDRTHDISVQYGEGDIWSDIEDWLPSDIMSNVVIESSPCGFKLYYYSPRVLRGTTLITECDKWTKPVLKLIGDRELSACWPCMGYTPIHGCLLTIKPLTRTGESYLFKILKKVVIDFGYTWRSPKTIRKTMSLN